MGWVVALLAATAAPSGELPAQIRIPLEAEHGWFTVSVILSGTDTARFIVDTGASVSAVTRSTARRLGLESAGTVMARGASGSQRLERVRLPALSFGGITSWNGHALVLEDRVLTPYSGRLEGYAAYDGVLGMDLLRDYDLLIDPVKGALHLYGANDRLDPDLDARLAPPVAARRVGAGHLLRHEIHVNGVALPAILDTGARRVLLSSRAASAAGVETRPSALTGPETPGVGTESATVLDGDLERVVVGSTDLGALPAQVGDLAIFRALDFVDGGVVLLGTPALMRCAVFISYRTDEVRYCRSPG